MPFLFFVLKEMYVTLSLLRQTYYFMYQQQEAIYYALFDEVYYRPGGRGAQSCHDEFQALAT